jgi:hypothetical protein
MAIGLEMYRRQREEEKRRGRMREALNEVRQECEDLIKQHEQQRFMRVYILMAMDRIIHELAYRRSLGEADVQVDEDDDGKFVELTVWNEEMTQTDVRDILERNVRDKYIFNLVKALSFVDDFMIEPGDEGGVELTAKKYLNTEIIQ